MGVGRNIEFIEVIYSPLVNGVFHKSISYTNANGNRATIDFGPQNPRGIAGVLAELMGINQFGDMVVSIDFNNTNPVAGPRETILSREYLGNVFKEMAVFAKELAAAYTEYQATGRNSNYLADVVLLTVTGRLPVLDTIGTNFAPSSIPNPRCFPAGTLISLPGGKVRPIEAIAVGDLVLAHDDKGALVPARVSRLYGNVTDDWIELVWRDKANGEWRVLTATPGHVMLTPEGGFAGLSAMLSPFASCAAAQEAAQALMDDDRAGEGPDATVAPTQAKPNGPRFGRPAGFARIVTETGETVEAVAYRIAFGEATAHLYERAEMLVTRSEGGLAVQPQWKAAA